MNYHDISLIIGLLPRDWRRSPGNWAQTLGEQLGEKVMASEKPTGSNGNFLPGSFDSTPPLAFWHFLLLRRHPLCPIWSPHGCAALLLHLLGCRAKALAGRASEHGASVQATLRQESWSVRRSVPHPSVLNPRSLAIWLFDFASLPTTQWSPSSKGQSTCCIPILNQHQPLDTLQ